MLLLGVLGDPVSHSLSPVMHQAALRELGISGTYLPLRVASGDLGVALAGLGVLGWGGVNVTIPHKEAVIPFVSQMDPPAVAMGAVNTLYRVGGGWGGTNTDGVGFQAPLREQDWAGKTVTILGGGGSARAVIWACQELGMSAVQVVVRDPGRGQALAAQFAGIGVYAWGDLPRLLPGTDLLVNTTPVGMKAPDQTPIASALLGLLPRQAWVYDLIYVPDPTRLLMEAGALGYRTQSGLEMLVQQGAAALSLWLGGIPVPIGVMRQAVVEQLRQSRQ